MFKKVKGNRAIQKSHLRRLILSIETNNLLSVNPIIVNKDMEVVDGQHRLEAARFLGVPVFYVVSDKSGIEDVQTMNFVVKNWASIDYLNSYVSRGFSSYVLLKGFVEKFGVSVSIAIYLINGRVDNRSHALDTFRSGAFKCTVEEVKEAEKLAIKLDEISKYAEFGMTRDRNFIQALLAVYETVSHEELIEKIKANKRKLERRYGAKGYIYQFEEFLSFGKQKRVALY